MSADATERPIYVSSRRTETPMPNAFLCGGKPTPADLATIQEFAAALALPTKHQQAIALLEMGATDAEREALARHASRCCADCGTHTTPHKGCILR